MNVDSQLYDWKQTDLLEVTLPNPDAFSKIKNTLYRTGIPSRKEKNVLYQTAHILHKSGKYYIVHFKEMYALDGKLSTITYGDMKRRNAIAKKLEQFELLTINDPKQVEHYVDLNDIFIVGNKFKGDWKFVSKYKIGKKHG